MLTLSSMENLKVQCNLRAADEISPYLVFAYDFDY